MDVPLGPFPIPSKPLLFLWRPFDSLSISSNALSLLCFLKWLIPSCSTKHRAFFLPSSPNPSATAAILDFAYPLESTITTSQYSWTTCCALGPIDGTTHSARTSSAWKEMRTLFPLAMNTLSNTNTEPTPATGIFIHLEWLFWPAK